MPREQNIYFINNRKILVDILTILFGLGSWIGVNAMFVQLPLLVKTAPESWSLPSYMSIAVQLANLVPISYGLYRKYFSKHLNNTYWIYSLLFNGFASLILMASFYDHHSLIGDQLHSTAFLCLVFFTAIVGCSSSVLFYPYMSQFKEIYFISYFIGEGLGGFIPSILALVQGIGGTPECIAVTNLNGNITFVPKFKDPLFDTSTFFTIISFLSLISFCAYILLVNLNVCKNERVVIEDEHKMKSVKDKFLNADSFTIDPDTKFIKSFQINPIVLLILISIVSAFGNGVFPSIQSYSCLPYGNLAYHLVVTLGSMANPVACFLAIYFPRTSNRSILIITLICSAFVGYVLTTSIRSPTPPLFDRDLGIVIVVISWIAAIGLVSYIKLCILTIFRSLGESWIFYCGAFTQLGAALGSFTLFCLINYTNIFVPAKYCS